MSNAIRIKEEEEEPELQQMAETKEEPEPEPTKEEHIELWVFQKEGQMLVMQKTNTSVATPTHEEMLDNMPGLAQVMETKEEPEPVLIKEEQVDPCRDQNEVQLDLHIKLDTDSITVTSADEQNNSSDPEPNKNQLLPANRPEPENQEDSGRGDPSLRPDKRRQDTRSNGVNVNSSELKRQKTDTASCEICGKLFRMRQHLPDNIKIHTGGRGRPTIHITREQIDFLLAQGHTVKRMANILGCSASFLYKKSKALGVPIRGRLAAVTDEDLETNIRQLQSLDPNSGTEMMRGLLNARGLVVPRRNVRETTARINPMATARVEQRSDSTCLSCAVSQQFMAY
ncbi:uncharacterized protein LOC103463179 isoform X1 [Poecilia reticulata]|uniref:uncharacterized protein LOC103463179 isoform X1 n=1 Tax=Poecilia reticulata TaxID=8081 RepID=UPI0004A2AB28|nr:PREDICTED: uncharacterized protein LOC103463179 isoform X1 [Poecilia reticulata]XP_017159806.1 PREDICTED: uncharacterized protein LOC103463179 isoform X1 [Poecilia reticulata]